MNKLLYSVLPRGSENAIPASVLINALGVGDERAVRRCVRLARDSGLEILSTKKGYFLPDEGLKGDIERKKFCKAMSERGRNAFIAIKPVSSALHIHPLQMLVPEFFSLETPAAQHSGIEKGGAEDV